MKRIFKYQLTLGTKQVVQMPEGAEILSVQTQRNTPCVWAMVDVDKHTVNREFVIVGTGFEVPVAATEFIGTFQIDGGDYVFHLFEHIG